MKEVFYIDDTPANKISYYFMLVFLVALPFDRLYSELALIGLLLHTVIHLRKEQLRRLSFHWSGWLVVALYLVTIVATGWSHQQGLAFKEWEKQLALLLFPLIFYFTQLDWKRYQRQLLKAFAFSCLFTILYLYGVALSTIRSQGLPLSALFGPSFMNHPFSMPIDLHATYFSMYIAISLVTFTWLMIHSRRSLGRWCYALASLVLLAAILQLAARAVGISLLIIVNGILPFWLLKGRRRRNFLFVSLSLTALSFVIVFTNENLHNRYLVQLSADLKGNAGKIEDPEPRMVRWYCAWELIRASPWIGYGTGMEVEMLKEEYVANQLYDSYAFELNAHNQFLSFLLKAGFLGGVMYLGVLVMGFLQAFRLKDPFSGSFLVLVTCVSFSENILDVNKGIFFFSFFFSFFFCRMAAKRDGNAIFVPQYGNKNTLPLVGA
jgi:O-antigen ligase